MLAVYEGRVERRMWVKAYEVCTVDWDDSIVDRDNEGIENYGLQIAEY